MEGGGVGVTHRVRPRRASEIGTAWKIAGRKPSHQNGCNGLSATPAYEHDASRGGFEFRCAQDVASPRSH